MKVDYPHIELGEEVQFMPGYYIPMKEVRLEHDGREVLYIVGAAMVESSCCASGGCAYAIVPGYVVAWKSKRNEAGAAISEVEPVADQDVRRQIAKIIESTEGISNIDFW